MGRLNTTRYDLVELPIESPFLRPYSQACDTSKSFGESLQNFRIVHPQLRITKLVLVHELRTGTFVLPSCAKVKSTSSPTQPVFAVRTA